MKTIYLFMMLFATMAVSAQDAEKYTKQLEAVKLAINSKKTASLQPYLAAGYRMPHIPAGYENQLLPQILSAMPKVSSYEIVDEKAEGNLTRLVALYSPNAVKVDMLVDATGKIYELNLLEGTVEQKGTARVTTIGKCDGTKKS